MNSFEPLTNKEQVALQTFKQTLQQRLGDNLIALKLYGSKARGDAHPGSDVDVVVVARRLDPHVDDVVWDLEVDVLEHYGVVMEAFTMSQEEYETSLAQQWPFMLNLEREGISL